MPTTIDSAGITFNDATSLTSANGVPSALKLTTARTINGVAFDGTADITVPASGTSTAKAWVNFNGTTSPGTIRSSYNVSSVTRLASGNYEINLQNPLSDILYSCVATDGSRGVTSSNPLTISKFSVACYNPSFIPANEDVICAVVFGN
jgi:hypothetical protein